MPTLTWIGKKAILNHHREVPFHLLDHKEDLSVGDHHSGNMLIHGDNLVALKALLPYYAGKVKCIYIDPPYNKGAEVGWTYNDSVDSPEIKRWLGKAVGKEMEDLSRHDKWLCMMYPRIKLLVKFLRDDGFFLVSLDEAEMARFRLMMEEILPPKYFITNLIWKSRRNLDNRSLHNISVDHEYVIAYRMGKERFRGSAKDMTKYKNPDKDPRGPWMSDNLVGLATKERRPGLHYDLINPDTGDVYPCPAKGWRYSPKTMQKLISEGRILWPKKKTGRPRHKKFKADLKHEYAGFSSFISCGNTNEGTEEVSNIMGGEQFIFPKPRSLVQALIEQTTSGDDIVLDSFAGTGTTAHAVLAQNREDLQDRKFILVEMDEAICEKITYERINRVIKGYTYKDNKENIVSIQGLGGGFKYFTLGNQLFDEKGKIREDIAFSDLAAHVYFTETGEAIPRKNIGRSPLIGVDHKGVAVYLLYNGVLGDKRIESGNVLVMDLLNSLPHHNGPRIIYGEGCRITPAKLKQDNIVFKQIPYQIKTK